MDTVGDRTTPRKGDSAPVSSGRHLIYLREQDGTVCRPLSYPSTPAALRPHVTGRHGNQPVTLGERSRVDNGPVGAVPSGRTGVGAVFDRAAGGPDGRSALLTSAIVRRPAMANRNEWDGHGNKFVTWTGICANTVTARPICGIVDRFGASETSVWSSSCVE
jgi:hypothetical protein